MRNRHSEFAKEKVMIMSAPNGARRQYSDHPDIPLTPAELANEARQLLDQQVSVLHLHVRHPDGRHSLEADHYQAGIHAIEQAVGNELIIQVTSEAVGIYNRHQQMEMVRNIRPEAVSLALRELCPDPAAELDAAEFYAFLCKEKIWPQHILYTMEEVKRFEVLRRKGLFAQENPACLLVLGNYADEKEGSPEELAEKLEGAHFEDLPWSACCFGRSELACMLATTERGGHVRLGFENNLWLENGALAGSNAELIKQYRESLSNQSRVPATADEVRDQFLTFI
jgi:uncharacterized protein (DUF849 family)